MLSSPNKYQIVFLNSFPFDWYIIPLLLLGALTSPRAPFQRVNNEKTRKHRRFLSNCLLLPAILAQWRQPVASIVALDPLYWAICMVLYRRTTTAIKMTSKYGALFIIFFLAWDPIVHWDDTEWILARWWCPVASSEALDPLHQAMYAALQRRIILAIKTSRNGGVLFCIVDFDSNHNSR